jgi:hypothetical protein
LIRVSDIPVFIMNSHDKHFIDIHSVKEQDWVSHSKNMIGVLEFSIKKLAAIDVKLHSVTSLETSDHLLGSCITVM